MKILFIFPNAVGFGRVPLGMSIIMTIMTKKGHEIDLFDTTFLLSSDNTDNILREQSNLVLPTDSSHLYDPHSEEEVDEMFREKIRSFSPDLLAVTILEENYQLADRLLGIAKSLGRNIMTIVGGSTPTVVPEVVIENPLIDYLIQGEGEGAMEEFCDLLEMGKPVDEVRNLWYKKDGKVHSNPIRPYVDLDALPIQNLDLWNPGHFMKAYEGKLRKIGSFELSRGCPFKCTFCINEQYHRLLDEAGGYFRKKSIAYGIREIKALKEKMDLEMVFFCDDNFLQMSQERVREFTELWLSEINLPYWMNTTVETISYERLEMLKKTGCAGIGLGIESGSEWLRQKVLRKPSTNKRIENAFHMIHEFDIRTTANSIIGFPGEYEEDIFETIKLFKRMNPESFDVSFCAPYIGTPIHVIARKMGYVETMDKPGFRGMVPNITFRQGEKIKNPNISFQRLDQLYREFADYIEGRLPIPEKFMKPAPGTDGTPRGELGIEVIKTLQSLGADSSSSDEMYVQDEDLVPEHKMVQR